jgi:hypothetical protein
MSPVEAERDCHGIVNAAPVKQRIGKPRRSRCTAWLVGRGVFFDEASVPLGGMISGWRVAKLQYGSEATHPDHQFCR